MKTLWEREKLLATSIFSFSKYDFYCFKNKSYHLSLVHFDVFSIQSRLITTLWKKALGNTVGKEKMLIFSIFSFPTMFSTLSWRDIIFILTFNFLSAYAFSLVLLKMFCLVKSCVCNICFPTKMIPLLFTN